MNHFMRFQLLYTDWQMITLEEFVTFGVIELECSYNGRS